MAKKGQVFQQYTEEFKITAVKEYIEGSTSYKAKHMHLLRL
jgi:transposase